MEPSPYGISVELDGGTGGGLWEVAHRCGGHRPAAGTYEKCIPWDVVTEQGASNEVEACDTLSGRDQTAAAGSENIPRPIPFYGRREIQG